MRGKPTSCVTPSMVTRITPADAGKTYSKTPRGAHARDHPRGCGENGLCFTELPDFKGSPPRMRGKHAVQPADADSRRITPADAGKTVPVFGHRAHNRDHPRGCGENYASRATIREPAGSPPRMRGKPHPARLSRRWYRITPADAGKTSRRLMASRWSLGSPPRMRGKLRAGRLVDYPAGITPADAGKTRSAFGYIPA